MQNQVTAWTVILIIDVTIAKIVELKYHNTFTYLWPFLLAK